MGARIRPGENSHKKLQMSWRIARLLRLLQCPSSKWSALQVDIGNLLGDGDIAPEDLSRILCRFLDVMAGESEKNPGEACLGNLSTRRVAR